MIRDPEPTSPSAGQTRLTVLVVEDEAMVRVDVADYLRDCGMRILEATNGDEAVAVLLADEAIDVVFSDVRMPGKLNGFELARWVRQNRPRIRILLASGYSGEASGAGDDRYNDKSFLVKPYSYRSLLQHIYRLAAQPH